MLKRICLLFTLVGCMVSGQNANAQKATNPIIFANVPDMSIIRVRDTYYMGSTTMLMSPGVPIMKSKDLVYRQLVNYAYDTLVSNDTMNLENGKNTYGRGSWALRNQKHRRPAAFDFFHISDTIESKIVYPFRQHII